MKNQQLVRKGTGRDFDYAQDHCFVKLASNATGGAICLVEDKLKPGFSLGRHHHQQMTEVFYMLEGEVEFRFDDESITLRPGDTLMIPPNTWHAAECKLGGRMLTIFGNGHFDEYLARLNDLSDDQIRDREAMRALSEEFDIFEADERVG